MSFETEIAETGQFAGKVEAQAKGAVTDLRALIANRVGDVLIAAIVLASIWLGHVL